MIFLIEYDRARGSLIHVTPYGSDDAEQADVARLALELECMRTGLEHEIVILEAASESQLRKTHRRYFEGLEQLANPDSALVALKAA